ncbi:MAG TPA: cytochrome C, partial [Sporosarcina sp.]|nr:cytochrome C [Sporosarcina sp.]
MNTTVKVRQKEKTVKRSIKETTNRMMGIGTDDAKLAKSYMSVAFLALLIGGVLGLLQGLERAGLMQLPHWFNYYQVLTAHGVLLVLV